MTSAQEWARFAAYLSQGEWTAYGKEHVRRFHNQDNGQHYWSKEGEFYAREIAIHAQMRGKRLHHSGQLQSIHEIRIDEGKLISHDAGCDVWQWLWHTARPIGAESSPTLVKRACHSEARHHILNWDDTLLRFAAGCLRALHPMHKQRLVHFDLHFANWTYAAHRRTHAAIGHANSTDFQIDCGIEMARPALIDFSESLWQAVLPLRNLPRHLTVPWLSPRFRALVESVQHDAMRARPDFRAADRLTRLQMLVDPDWCEASGLANHIGDALAEGVDWREDLYQLGYFLSHLCGRLVDGERQGFNLELAGTGRRKPETEVVECETIPAFAPLSRGANATAVRAVAPLPSAQRLSERDQSLRPIVESVVQRLLAFGEIEQPGATDLPHEPLINEIETGLINAGYTPHGLIQFSLVGPRMPVPATAKRKPLEEFQDASERWCPVVVAIPALPGQNRAEAQGAVGLDCAIAVSKDPITVEQFSEFMAYAGRVEPRWRVAAERAHHPMTHVTRMDCEEWLAWFNERLASQLLQWQRICEYRLLTAAEWHHCCTAGREVAYLIGIRGCDDIRQGDAIYKFSEKNNAGERWRDCENKVEAQAIDHPWNKVNAYKLRACHGNVWEMVASIADVSATEAKGGSYASAPWELAASYKRALNATDHGPDIGFRICRNLLPHELEQNGGPS